MRRLLGIVLAIGLAVSASADGTVVPSQTCSGSVVSSQCGASSSADGDTILFDALPGTTTTGTSEQILYTFSIPAATWSAVGDEVLVDALWITAANANTKVPRLRHTNVAGTNLNGVSSAVNNGSFHTFWTLKAVDTTSKLFVDFYGFPTSTASIAGLQSTTCTFSGSCVFVLTGLTATAAGDLTLVWVKITQIAR